MKKNIFILVFIVLLFRFNASLYAQVTIVETGKSVVLTNEFASFTFNKQNADLKSIRYDGYKNLLGNKGSAYLSGPDFAMSPAVFSVTTHTENLIDISFLHRDKNHFSYDLHYVVRNGISGIYVYLVEKHDKGDTTGIYGQTRWGLRADPNLFDYHLVRDSIRGPMYPMDSLESGRKIQDWTYQMRDGTIYTKYDYADYIDGRYVHGTVGQKSHLGLFVIQASPEYLNGGPTKQYMTIHSSPYLICMFNCSHFLSTIRNADDTVTQDWEKINGPFLLYVNKGKDVENVWSDAKRAAAKERRQWPFHWLENPLYPLQRGTLDILSKDEFGKPLEGVTFILADSAHDWQAQSTGYIFWGKTAQDGQLALKNIRPGRYTLYGFGANRMQEFRKDGIEITGDASHAFHVVLPDETRQTIWQIGKADRFTKGFHYADHKRAYGLFDSVPGQLDFKIGVDNDSDWYYAQTKKGKWNILFDKEVAVSSDSLTLYIALAGAAKDPHLSIVLNGVEIAAFNNLGNDRSIYRSAILGGYYQLKKVRFTSSLLSIHNTLSLDLTKCPSGGGVMYDAIRLATY